MELSEVTQSAEINENNSSESNNIGFVIAKNDFIKALGHVQSVVEKRNTIAILSNVKIKVENGQIELTATDMDISVTETVKAETFQNGSLTVNANTLYDIVRKLPDTANINIEGDSNLEGKISIKSGSCNFSLASLPSENFPVVETGEMPYIFNLTSSEIIALIDKTKFSISTEETRYYLNGIYLHSHENQLVAVATDGHRLSKIFVDLPETIKELPGIIIPRKTVAEVRRLAEQTQNNIEISVSNKKIQFVFDNVILLSKLIDGTFPDYNKVIPTSNNKSLIVNNSDLSKSVDRVSIISSDKTKAIKLNVSENKLTLKSNSEENGSAEEQLEVSYNDDEFEVGFNSRYVLDVLSVIEGDDVEFLFSEVGSPVLVKDSKDPASTFVVMPMRI